MQESINSPALFIVFAFQETSCLEIVCQFHALFPRIFDASIFLLDCVFHTRVVFLPERMGIPSTMFQVWILVIKTVIPWVVVRESLPAFDAKPPCHS